MGSHPAFLFFSFQWNVELNEEKHSVGRIEVNPIESLNSLMKEDTMKGCDNTISLRDLDIDTFCDDDTVKRLV